MTEYNNLLKRLSDVEERIEQLEKVAVSTGGMLEQLVGQILEIREALSRPPQYIPTEVFLNQNNDL